MFSQSWDINCKFLTILTFSDLAIVSLNHAVLTILTLLLCKIISHNSEKKRSESKDVNSQIARKKSEFLDKKSQLPLFVLFSGHLRTTKT